MGQDLYNIICQSCGMQRCQLQLIKKITEHKDEKPTTKMWIQISCSNCGIIYKEDINND